MVINSVKNTFVVVMRVQWGLKKKRQHHSSAKNMEMAWTNISLKLLPGVKTRFIRYITQAEERKLKIRFNLYI